jgi:hypothetical protein
VRRAGCDADADPPEMAAAAAAALVESAIAETECSGDRGHGLI